MCVTNDRTLITDCHVPPVKRRVTDTRPARCRVSTAAVTARGVREGGRRNRVCAAPSANNATGLTSPIIGRAPRNEHLISSSPTRWPPLRHQLRRTCFSPFVSAPGRPLHFVYTSKSITFFKLVYIISSLYRVHLTILSGSPIRCMQMIFNAMWIRFSVDKAPSDMQLEVLNEFRTYNENIARIRLPGLLT